MDASLRKQVSIIRLYLHTYISSLIKNRVGDDGTRAIVQYRPTDLYLTDRKETMTIYPHSSPHLQVRLSLVHPFLPQDLDLPCNARASF